MISGPYLAEPGLKVYGQWSTDSRRRRTVARDGRGRELAKRGASCDVASAESISSGAM